MGCNSPRELGVLVLRACHALGWVYARAPCCSLVIRVEPGEPSWRSWLGAVGESRYRRVAVARVQKG